MIESTCADCDYSPCVCGESMVKEESSKARDKQVGGSHYKDLPIQPTEYIRKNKLGWCEGNVVKYITRWQTKGGKQDLEKCIHYIELLIEDLPPETTFTKRRNK